MSIQSISKYNNQILIKHLCNNYTQELPPLRDFSKNNYGRLEGNTFQTSTSVIPWTDVIPIYNRYFSVYGDGDILNTVYKTLYSI